MLEQSTKWLSGERQGEKARRAIVRRHLADSLRRSRNCVVDDCGIDIRVTGRHAGWQQRVERHDGFQSDNWNTIMCEFHDFERQQAKWSVCKQRTRVRTRSSMVLSFYKRGNFRTCFPFSAVARVGRPATNTASLRRSPSTREVLFPSDTSVLLSAASVQKHKQSGLNTLARTCSGSGCEWAKPIFHRPSEHNVVVGSRTFEVCLCGRSNGCRRCGTDP